MSKKVYVQLTVNLFLNVDEGVEIGDVLAEMDYDFSYPFDGADLLNSEIENWEVLDSK